MMSDGEYHAYLAAAKAAFDIAAPRRTVQTVYTDAGDKERAYSLAEPLSVDIGATAPGQWVSMRVYTGRALLLRAGNGTGGGRVLNYLMDVGDRVGIRADRIVRVESIERSVADAPVDISTVDMMYWGDVPTSPAPLYARALRVDPEGAEALRVAYKTTDMTFAEYVDRLADMAEPPEEEVA